MTVPETLDKIFLENPLSSWLLAAGIALATLLLLGSLRFLINKRFTSLAKATSTIVDDLVVQVLSLIHI